MSSKGLEHRKTYRIQSVFDGSFVDLHNASTAKGTMIKTWERNGSSAQSWLADTEGDGFRLGTQVSSGDSLMVMDMSPSHQLLLWQFHGGKNQQFYTDPCNESGVFLVRCSQNGYAIRNQGRGNQVKCVSADKNDISQQWRLV